MLFRKKPEKPKTPSESCLKKQEMYNSVLKDVQKVKANMAVSAIFPEKGEKEKRNETIQTLRSTHDLIVSIRERMEELTRGFDPENFRSSTIPFMLDFFENKWGFDTEGLEKASINIQKPEVIPDIDTYLAKLSEVSSGLKDNPDNVGKVIQWGGEDTIENIEKLKITVINPTEEQWYKDLETRLKRTPRRHEVFAEIPKQYPDKTLAGLDFYIKAIQFAEKSPENAAKLKSLLNCPDEQWRYCLCPGSSFCSRRGVWRAPSVYWRGSVFYRSGIFLIGLWEDIDRIIVLG